MRRHQLILLAGITGVLALLLGADAGPPPKAPQLITATRPHALREWPANEPPEVVRNFDAPDPNRRAHTPQRLWWLAPPAGEEPPPAEWGWMAYTVLALAFAAATPWLWRHRRWRPARRAVLAVPPAATREGNARFNHRLVFDPPMKVKLAIGSAPATEALMANLSWGGVALSWRGWAHAKAPATLFIADDVPPLPAEVVRQSGTDVRLRFRHLDRRRQAALGAWRAHQTGLAATD